MAYLADFSETEMEKFKLVAGNSCKEVVNVVVYPTNVVYLHSSGVNELRTPNVSIHHQVYKKKFLNKSSLFADKLLFQVLKEIGLLPQLYNNDRGVITFPSRKYSD